MDSLTSPEAVAMAAACFTCLAASSWAMADMTSGASATAACADSAAWSCTAAVK